MDVVKRTFGTALQLMNEYPDYTYTQSAAQYNEWMAEKYPEMNDADQAAGEGRAVGDCGRHVGGAGPEHAGWRERWCGSCWWGSVLQEAVWRGWRGLAGIRIRLGTTGSLPQIYKRSGMDYFVTQKMHWNDTNQLPFKLFWWESPDGSKVLTYFPHDYANTQCEPDAVVGGLCGGAAAIPGTTEMLDLYGIGDHGGGPTRAMLDQATHWMAAGAR